MTRICNWCGREFENAASRRPHKYCSRDCCRQAANARLRETRARFSAEAKRLGISCTACRLMSTRKDYHPMHASHKSYMEIVRANRARRVQSGWRGQVVLGGGAIHHNAPLTIQEID